MIVSQTTKGAISSFFLTVHYFMNVVRYKLKTDCVDKYFEVFAGTRIVEMTKRKFSLENYMIPGTIWPVVMYAPTRAIRPTRANLPFSFSAFVF